MELKVKVSLGPILFFWPKQTIYDFYAQMLDTSVDTIYLGETVCSKRRELKTAEWIELASQLAESGKEVVLSSLALLMADSELSALRTICDNAPVKVEANDIAAVQLMSEKKLPFVCGPSTNIYNARTLKLMQRHGATRWVMPVELSGHCLQTILKDADAMGFADQIETEVFSYGHLPLAYSARCFTARYLDLPKDDCRFSCIDYPEGIEVRSQEKQALFNINGIQTQSSSVYNLLGQVGDMQDMGVDMLRVSPRAQGTANIIEQFKQAAKNKGQAPLAGQIPLVDHTCTGDWSAQPGMNTVNEEDIFAGHTTC
jgi:collagenase-like PrtC family protease